MTPEEHVRKYVGMAQVLFAGAIIEDRKRKLGEKPMFTEDEVIDEIHKFSEEDKNQVLKIAKNLSEDDKESDYAEEEG